MEMNTKKDGDEHYLFATSHEFFAVFLSHVSVPFNHFNSHDNTSVFAQNIFRKCEDRLINISFFCALHCYYVLITHICCLKTVCIFFILL